MVETVTRNPRMQGFPPMTAGLWVMRERFISLTFKLCDGLSDRDSPHRVASVHPSSGPADVPIAISLLRHLTSWLASTAAAPPSCSPFTAGTSALLRPSPQGSSTHRGRPEDPARTD